MWCYQKPGFEALLLAELQKQQQCSQFCDTLLKAEGVSVPAHSCVLSAFSPQISSALSSTSVPPAGQSRLLEFRTVGACTLLHMVRLLYSGEMAGEGEKEKREAISAAAKLGIHGLVEVTKKDHKSRNEGVGGQQTEVGVQTEPHVPEEGGLRRGRWRREVRDASTPLWKEILSDGQRDMCTQTEEVQISTTDVSTLHGLQTEFHFLPPQIPYVPISLVYQSDENETAHPSSQPAASMQDTTSPEHTSVAIVAPPCSSAPPSFHPFSNQVTPCATDPQSWWTGPPAAVREDVVSEEWEDERLKQFQGNIPGFISYFLNPNEEEGSRRGRARRRQGARVRGARGAGTSERRARRPRRTTGGKGRGGLTQMVDVQDVGVSKLQKLFLQRGGVGASRPGQGGGAVGRKLYLKTRELLKPQKNYQRRRRCGKEWDFSQNGDVLPLSQGGGGDNKRCQRRKTEQQFNQDITPAGRVWSVRPKPTTSFSLSSPHMPFYSVHSLPGSSSAVQPSSHPSLPLPVATYTSPASSILHTISLPPPVAPQEEQPEHIHRLLEEVMMGLDILTNSNAAPHSEPADLNSTDSSTCASSQNNLTQNKQQNRATDLLEACQGAHGSTQVGAVTGSSGSSSARLEVPILQQQEEGELTDILDHFLQSFEQHIYNTRSREKKEMGGEDSTKTNQPITVLSKHRKTETQTITSHSPHVQNTCRLQPAKCSQTAITPQQSDRPETQSRCSQTRKAAAHRGVSPKPAGGASGKARSSTPRKKKRGTGQYIFSLERKSKKPVSSTKRKPRILPDQDKQLQQMPVVRLERSGPLSAKVTLQGHCQSREVKNSTKKKTSSPSVKYPHNKKQPILWITKTYPIRSRVREGNVMDSFFEEPSVHKPDCRRGRARKNIQFPGLSNGEGSTPQVQPQPVEPCGMEKQRENKHDRLGEDLTVQPQEETEGPPRRGQKRGTESEEETSDGATGVKKVYIEQTAQPNTDTCIPGCVSEAATVEVEDLIDVETVSLSSVVDDLQRQPEDKKTVWSEIIFMESKDRLVDEEMESSSDEIINVDGDSDEMTDQEKERDNLKEQAAPALPRFHLPPSHSAKLASLVWTGSWENEHIDVIGGSSPLPDPVTITWRESSEGEEDEGDGDVDVVDCA